MKLILTIRYTLSFFWKALLLSPLVVMLVIFSEGVQHIVEWKLGMYESHEAFVAMQRKGERLGFGIAKALSVLVACYFVPKKLSMTFGPPARFGSFNKDILRKLWDPRGGLHGMIAMILCAIPLIVLHYQLSNFAIGNENALVLLVLDSVLIGALALILGTSIWAVDMVDMPKVTTSGT